MARLQWMLPRHDSVSIMSRCSLLDNARFQALNPRCRATVLVATAGSGKPDLAMQSPFWGELGCSLFHTTTSGRNRPAL